MYLKGAVSHQIHVFSMISSMTGYGRAEKSAKGLTVVAEVRSVNSRYLEVSSRLPRTLSARENDIKELVKSKLLRGKISIALSLVEENGSEIAVSLNTAAAKAYYKLLNDLKKAIKSRETVTLEHVLKFPEVLEPLGVDGDDEKEWETAKQALLSALDGAVEMRRQEGEELRKDLKARVRQIDATLDMIDKLATGRVAEEKARLQERIAVLVADPAVIDAKRMELEISILADRLDVTEECVRFRSHNKFFLHGLEHEEGSGRKLNFLTQEMNREANTIGSKANNAEIAHHVVGIKEELEKIREQLQNIE